MDCPYFSLPEANFWKNVIAGKSIESINPHLPSDLYINQETKIGSAGSCFAQYISQALVQKNYHYFITELPPQGLPEDIAERYGYGQFSARYGNIYTPSQLLQMIERAFEGRTVADQFYQEKSGRFYDLLRPRIMPNGFSSLDECEADLEQHLCAIRKLFMETEVFIFTLGLTEAWLSKRDNIVYPSCPGCGSAGNYDSEKYFFHNFNVTETTRDLDLVITKLNKLNPKIKIILTVSPVPLLATMEKRHVLQASVYSKSVLRVAAEEAVRKYDNVYYFASYELITATAETKTFYNEDRRTISQIGINHAMRSFFSQFTKGDALINSSNFSSVNSHDANKETRPICDEEEFFRALPANSFKQQKQNT